MGVLSWLRRCEDEYNETMRAKNIATIEPHPDQESQTKVEHAKQMVESGHPDHRLIAYIPNLYPDGVEATYWNNDDNTSEFWIKP